MSATLAETVQPMQTESAAWANVVTLAKAVDAAWEAYTKVSAAYGKAMTDWRKVAEREAE